MGVNDSVVMCTAYCSHGGRCSLPPYHPEKLHETHGPEGQVYCRFTTEEALTREEADAVNEKTLQESTGIEREVRELQAILDPMADLIEKIANRGAQRDN